MMSDIILVRKTWAVALNFLRLKLGFRLLLAYLMIISRFYSFFYNSVK